jgi:hypothetical protein
MEPTYQRKGRLWSTEDKELLVDSILNDYDIPKVYLADFTFGNSRLNEKRLPYAIIDGKQRFEAIFDFFDAKITLAQDFVYRDDPSLSLAGLSYLELRRNYPEVADKYDNFHLSVMRVIADDEEQINNLFLRLNRSKPLTGAEIRNAMVGPAPRLIREITKHHFFQDNIRFAVARGEDLNTSAKLLLFEYEGKLTDTKRQRLDSFVKDTRDLPRADIEQAARRTVDVLDQMTGVFIEHDSLLSAAGIIPVYYWLVRHTEQKKQPFLREFLLKFEKDRSLNKQLAKVGEEDQLDKELVAYETYSRSTNDEGSHVGRFNILSKRFSTYLNRREARGTSKRRDIGQEI